MQSISSAGGPRPVGGTVPAGGVAGSAGTGLSEISYSIAGDFEDVHNLSVTLATRGRPVKLFLTSESGSASSYFYLTRAQEGGNDPRAKMRLVRGGSVGVGNYTISISNPGVFLIIPSSSVSFYDGAPRARAVPLIPSRCAWTNRVFSGFVT